MNYEFMLADTSLPPCLPLPKTAVQLPISSTVKVLYACLLNEIMAEGIEDINGILYYSNHTGKATLPLRWLCQLPLCGLAAGKRLQTIIPRQQVYKIYL